jgi:hypothetical protein
VTKFFENPVAATIFVGVFAALGFLGLTAVVDGVESADYITAPLVGIGGAVGYRIGRRRADAKRARQ